MEAPLKRLCKCVYPHIRLRKIANETKYLFVLWILKKCSCLTFSRRLTFFNGLNKTRDQDFLTFIFLGMKVYFSSKIDQAKYMIFIFVMPKINVWCKILIPARFFRIEGYYSVCDRWLYVVIKPNLYYVRNRLWFMHNGLLVHKTANIHAFPECWNAIK